MFKSDVVYTSGAEYFKNKSETNGIKFIQLSNRNLLALKRAETPFTLHKRKNAGKNFSRSSDEMKNEESAKKKQNIIF